MQTETRAQQLDERIKKIQQNVGKAQDKCDKTEAALQNLTSKQATQQTQHTETI